MHIKNWRNQNLSGIQQKESKETIFKNQSLHSVDSLKLNNARTLVLDMREREVDMNIIDMKKVENMKNTRKRSMAGSSFRKIIRTVGEELKDQKGISGNEKKEMTGSVYSAADKITSGIKNIADESLRGQIMLDNNADNESSVLEKVADNQNAVEKNKVGVLDLTRNGAEVRKWNENSARAQNDAHHTQENKNFTKITVNLKDVKNKTPEELLDLAESLKIENPSYLQKHDLVFTILKVLSEQGATIVGDGMLEILQDGYGFLRSSEANYIPGPDDIYVSPVQVKKFALRTGDTIVGPIRAPKKGERYFALTNIHLLTGVEISQNRHRMHFDDLTPIYPMKQMKLETGAQDKDLSGRIIDIVAPLGRGQRALIVAPPRTGKTILMQNISHSISVNYPEISLIVLLIGERPEEVTDMSRSVKGEVVSSTFDEPSYRHVQLAEMVIEKAKRMVERKQDVVILLDSITRLARAYNDVVPSSGKVLSGGVDSNALQKPKRLLGAARNTEEGGSLTVIATALIETGSRMDEVIFEEFKGTGNLEIVLDRKISDKRIFPAIDIAKSGTRKEDLLVDKSVLSKMWVLRRIMNPMGTTEAIEFLHDKLRYYKSNSEFFDQMNTYKEKEK